MHFGMIMECDYRYGTTQEDAFSEAFNLVDAAESGGMDGVWLAERHFAAPLNPLDDQGAGIPSIVSAPLIMASAIAARTERLRIGIAVNVLPLNHPIRMAEEVATVDQVSRGRFRFRRRAQRVRTLLRRLWHSLRRKPGKVPGVLGRHPGSLDQRTVFTPREVLFFRQRLRPAQALPAAIPAGEDRRHNCRHVSQGGRTGTQHLRGASRHGPSRPGA